MLLMPVMPAMPVMPVLPVMLVMLVMRVMRVMLVMLVMAMEMVMVTPITGNSVATTLAFYDHSDVNLYPSTSKSSQALHHTP